MDLLPSLLGLLLVCTVTGLKRDQAYPILERDAFAIIGGVNVS